MFAKLLKHEWRATAPSMGGLCAAILSLGVLGMVTLTALIRRAEELNELAAGSMALSMVFIYLAIVICVAASGILLMIRFYKSRFTDQGYLTFTLPVSVHQNFLSAFINQLLWTVLVSIATCVAFGLMGVAVYNAVGADAFAEVKEELKYIYDETIGQAEQTLASVLPGYILQLAVSFVYSTVVAMTCLTVGATIAKKHKILAAIGVYYFISMATGMIQNSLTMSITLRMEEMLEGSPLQIMEEASRQLLMVTIPMQILVIVGCYFLSTTLMKKKLNLN